MKGRNGTGAAILAWLAKHPGSTAAEIGKGVGYDHSTGLLTYMRHAKQVFVAGPRHWHRYYLTLDEAVANHERICAEAVATRQRKAREADRAAALRKRGRRHAAGKKPLNMAGAALAHTPLGRGVQLHPDVRIVVAPAPSRGRFDPEPGFERVITSDYMLRRQGFNHQGHA